MDLKIKSKAWVGNIYQKFEAMCQDVDDFVSKDTVKYVGNQVQTVGVGVKKLYSDVVQDLLPQVDPFECRAQATTEKPNVAIGDYFKSIVGNKEKSFCVGDEKLNGDQKILDLLKCCSSSISCKPDHGPEFLCPSGENPSEEAETDFASQHNGGDAIIGNSNIIEEPPFAQNISSLEERTFSGVSLKSSDDYQMNMNTLDEVLLPTPLYDSDFESPQTDQNIRNSSSDEIGGVQSNILNEEQLVSENISSSKDGTFSGVSDDYHIKTTLLELSSPTSLHGLEFKYPQEDRTIDTSSSEDIKCIQSSISSIKEVLSTESFNNEDVGVLSTISQSSFPSLSNGRMDDTVEDIAASTMETIDLSDKTTVNESCIVTENRLVFPVSGSARSFGSYKKLLKDAFTLRKRLTKEYEQLAIWYGDIDAEASQHFGSRPSAATNHSLTSQTNETWESEWELL